MKAMNPEEMAGLHLFYHPFSNCASRVLLLLEEKELKFDKYVINLLTSEQLTEEYRRITPKCEVPAIVHNGKAMHESVEIMRYIEMTFPEVRLSPTEAALKKEMDEWLDAAAASHEPGVVNYVYSSGIGRLPTPADWAFYQQYIPHRTQFHLDRRSGLSGCNKEKATKILYEQFSQLEKKLEHSDWLVGNAYSLADIAWFPNAFVLQILGFSFSDFPNIQAWMKRIQERPAFKDRYRKEFPPLPLWLVGCIGRLAARMIRKTGNRS